jgi:hypothetical protein
MKIAETLALQSFDAIAHRLECRASSYTVFVLLKYFARGMGITGEIGTMENTEK